MKKKGKASKSTKKAKVFKMDSGLGAAVSLLGDQYDYKANAEEVRSLAEKIKEVTEDGKKDGNDNQSQTREKEEV